MFLAFSIRRIIHKAVISPKSSRSVLALSLSTLAGILLALCVPSPAADLECAASNVMRHVGHYRLWLSASSHWQIPRESRVVADFDGDNKADFAGAIYTRNGYEIIVILSSRPDPVSLNPSMPREGIRLLACDINKDGFQDILVTTRAAWHPQAAWLGDGKGGFIAGDADYFDDIFGIGELPSYNSCTLPISPDIWNESRPFAGETPAIASVDPAAGRSGFVGFKNDTCLVQIQRLSFSLRSPPQSLYF